MFKTYSLTDKGLKRETNEDSFLINNNKNLLIVSDGMGGYEKGEVASSIIVETFNEKILEYEKTNEKTFDILKEHLNEAVKTSSKKIIDYSIEKKIYKTIGATIIGIYHDKVLNKTISFHLGDSRAYKVKESELQQLTKDHTYKGNVISKAIGNFDPFELDISEIDIENDDLIILCSDGVYNFISDEKVVEILQTHSLKECCQEMKKAIYENGAKDNLTMILAIQE
jgi:protein phosphatase